MLKLLIHNDRFSIRVYITFDEIESYEYITDIYPIVMDREKVTESGIKMY